jgi:hypothetical protein
VLKEVGETRAALPLVSRADVVVHHDREDWGSVVLLDEHAEPVRQRGIRDRLWRTCGGHCDRSDGYEARRGKKPAVQGAHLDLEWVNRIIDRGGRTGYVSRTAFSRARPWGENAARARSRSCSSSTGRSRFSMSTSIRNIAVSSIIMQTLRSATALSQAGSFPRRTSFRRVLPLHRPRPGPGCQKGDDRRRLADQYASRRLQGGDAPPPPRRQPGVPGVGSSPDPDSTSSGLGRLW